MIRQMLEPRIIGGAVPVLHLSRDSDDGAKGNIAVEFYYDGFPGYATLSFYNMPKYGTKLDQ